MIYFKRFYTLHSFIEFDYEFMTVACIFLACKIEERNFYQQKDENEPRQVDADFLVKALLPVHYNNDKAVALEKVYF
jgi:hypothetical protein